MTEQKKPAKICPLRHLAGMGLPQATKLVNTSQAGQPIIFDFPCFMESLDGCMTITPNDECVLWNSQTKKCRLTKLGEATFGVH